MEKGEESLLARGWLADHAQTEITVQYFIWSTDNIGTLAAETLLRSAERGVQVRVLVDDFLIDAPSEIMLALGLHPNIHIKIYNPNFSVGISRLRKIYNVINDFRSVNQRMHDKTFTVDGQIAIVGGRNMADEYFDYDHHYNFRDRDILLLGSVVSDIKDNFESFWKSHLSVPVETLLDKNIEQLSRERIDQIYTDLHAYAKKTENYDQKARSMMKNLPSKFPGLLKQMVWEDVRFISDIPGKNAGNDGLGGGSASTDALVTVIKNAKKSIFIQSPYLVMPKGGIKLFQSIVRKGVKVRISTNSLASTDNLKAFSGYSKQRDKLLQSGIEIFEFRPDSARKKELIDRYDALENLSPIFSIHAKTLVVDRETLFIGTFNLDPRSANLNTEVGVLIKNKRIAEQVVTQIKMDMLPENSWSAKDSPDVNASWEKRIQLKLWRMIPLKPLL